MGLACRHPQHLASENQALVHLPFVRPASEYQTLVRPACLRRSLVLLASQQQALECLALELPERPASEQPS